MDLGKGYPYYVAKELREIYPDIEFEFYNRGCSGHLTQTLVDRWQRDAVDMDPDVITILIGVNDSWSPTIGEADYVSDEQYEKNYRFLLTEMKEKTHAAIIVLEQFAFDRENTKPFRRDLDNKILVTRRVAREFADLYIPLDGILAAHSVQEDEYLLCEDGVHPTPYGAEVISAYVTDAICAIIDG